MPKKSIGELKLQSGRVLQEVELAYQTYGTLDADGANAIVVCHALTGDTYPGRYKELKGWWEGIVGPGAAIDTRKYFVLCSNVLGGCYGSTGPSSWDPETERQYGMNFPVIQIADMVAAQIRLAQALGIGKLYAVVGGSMGGMQALEWGRQRELPVERVIVLAAPARLSPQAIAFNEVQRQAIMLDPAWRGGEYYGREIPASGLAVARMVGTLTYRSEQSLEGKFGRRPAWRTGVVEDPYQEFHGRFDVQSYLNYQGEALVRRFDPNSYLYLSKAMDLFDLARGNRGLLEGVAQLQGRLSCVGVDTDVLFPLGQQEELVRLRREAGYQADYYELNSVHGHDAFLIEKEKLAPVISAWLS